MHRKKERRVEGPLWSCNMEQVVPCFHGVYHGGMPFIVQVEMPLCSCNMCVLCAADLAKVYSQVFTTCVCTRINVYFTGGGWLN